MQQLSRYQKNFFITRGSAPDLSELERQQTATHEEDGEKVLLALLSREKGERDKLREDVVQLKVKCSTL